MLTLMLLFQGCIFIQPFHSHISASAIHWTVHWFFADFRFSLILNLPLVVCFYYRGVYLSNLSICKFPLQLNIEPSTDCLQISASAIHWNFHCLSADIGLILNLPLVVCLRLGPSASGRGASRLWPSAAALRAARLRRSAPAALHEFKPGICTCSPMSIIFPTFWFELCMIQFQLNIDEYYLCHQSFVELAFRHCLRLSGLSLRKIIIGSFWFPHILSKN